MKGQAVFTFMFRRFLPDWGWLLVIYPGLYIGYAGVSALFTQRAGHVPDVLWAPYLIMLIVGLLLAGTWTTTALQLGADRPSIGLALSTVLILGSVIVVAFFTIVQALLGLLPFVHVDAWQVFQRAYGTALANAGMKTAVFTALRILIAIAIGFFGAVMITLTRFAISRWLAPVLTFLIIAGLPYTVYRTNGAISNILFGLHPGTPNSPWPALITASISCLLWGALYAVLVFHLQLRREN
ncbi:hypothetical protein [Schleiferilactobacillus shenzhenensis]|uniref:Uncharacterized protein n=1 Tax=Schleiferilactobacillus shenzhenensis LY-73 TaxID=1231336 RepID=U4TJD1_9LACO|nr:hypothetical protein [Schleiferilactobacillus shenzhenensis]ERL64921.1 hypothetical protein L248_0525 [Schleiferilactobacillus shenzhenensis LY-73]